jgi:hypothetical protein
VVALTGQVGHDRMSKEPYQPLDIATLSIIDCPVDASENLRLTQRLGVLVVPTAQ